MYCSCILVMTNKTYQIKIIPFQFEPYFVIFKELFEILPFTFGKKTPRKYGEGPDATFEHVTYLYNFIGLPEIVT